MLKSTVIECVFVASTFLFGNRIASKQGHSYFLVIWVNQPFKINRKQTERYLRETNSM